MNAHRVIRMAKAQIANVLDLLDHTLGGNDAALRSDALEGETSLHEVVSGLLAENEDDDGMIESLEAQIAIRTERQRRFQHRIDARKKAIASLMDCAAVTKLALPEATISLRTLAPRAKVVDAASVPDAFVIVSEVRKPDLAAISEAVERGAAIPGVVMTNGGSSLTVRRK